MTSLLVSLIGFGILAVLASLFLVAIRARRAALIRFTSAALSAALVAMFVACGGGGPSANKPETPNPAPGSIGAPTPANGLPEALAGNKKGQATFTAWQQAGKFIDVFRENPQAAMDIFGNKPGKKLDAAIDGLSNISTSDCDPEAVAVINLYRDTIKEIRNEGRQAAASSIGGAAQPQNGGQAMVGAAADAFLLGDTIRNLRIKADQEEERARSVLSARYNVSFPSIALKR